MEYIVFITHLLTVDPNFQRDILVGADPPHVMAPNFAVFFPKDMRPDWLRFKCRGVPPTG